MEHTHLVKGLDYALLQKIKAELETQKVETEESSKKIEDDEEEDEDNDDGEEGETGDIEPSSKAKLKSSMPISSK